MIGYAPHFPARRRQTFAEAFDQLCKYFDHLLAAENREVSVASISKSREAAMRAKKLFDAGDEDRGSYEIQCAYQYLEYAAKGKPAAEPLFESPKQPRA
jgi:hypothetical protein